MDVDDDEDFYSPEPTEATEKATKTEASASPTPVPKEEPKTELEEGEEEDEGGAMDEDDSDSDIDIITERKDGTKAAPPTQSRYSDIRNIPQRTASSDIAVKPAAPAAPSSKSPAPKFESPAVALAVPSADKVAAAASSSKIDVNGNPIHAGSGKHITAVNIDEDLGDNEKPWRKPGTDISDYFNCGFDEFTWALYAAKQEAIRGEFNGDLMMAGNNKMMEDFGKMMMMGGAAWWEEREALDKRMKQLLDNIEQIWLGGFKGIFSQHPRRDDLLSRFQKAFQKTLDKHLPSRRQVRGKKVNTAPKITLDPRILDLFVGLGDPASPDFDLDEALTDLLYFVVDILQFHGERNAYDEIDFDSIMLETYDALQAYHAGLKSSDPVQGAHTILILDKALHAFPWESLPCMDGLAVSRVPSMACLRRLILEQQDDAVAGEKTPAGHTISAKKGTYILNPGSDLPNTLGTFQKPLSALDATWSSVVSRTPSEAEFEAALRDSDVLLYFGHGSGAQYIRSKTIRRLDKCRAAALLMGCSSASLTEAGEFEVHGPVWNYMMAGCPAVVGTLWDVTDRDIDRFAGRLFEEWGLMVRGSFPVDKWSAGPANLDVVATRSVVEAVVKARDAVRFRYLTAGAVCVYGIPVYVRPDTR
ncbi:Separin like protein [Verticillium longisporum]|nr:Separin like protein [Verticillium longisporum]